MAGLGFRDEHIFGEFYITGQGWKSILSKEKFKPNTIYNTIVTYNGKQVIMYVNGIEQGEIDVTGSIGIPGYSMPMTMGCNPNPSGVGDSSYFQGKVYNAAVYSRGLSKAEVLKDAQNGLSQATGKYTILVGTTGVDINKRLEAKDEGRSGLQTMQYAYSTSNTQEPKIYSNFTNNGTVTKTSATGGTYYLWTNVLDKAGNRAEKTKVSEAYNVGYQIVYDGNGGTGAPDETWKAKSQTIKLSETIPTRAGYLFKGWAETNNATTATIQPGANYSKDSPLILYAVWEKYNYQNQTTNSYTITRRYRYENADGSFGAYTNIDSKAYNYGTTIPAWNRAADSTYKAASIAAYTVQAKNDTLSVNVMRNTSTNNKIQYRLQNADGSWGAYTQAWSGTLRAGQSHTWSKAADTTHQAASGTVQYNGGTVSVDVKRKVGRFVIKANGGSGDRTTSNLYYGQTNNNISPMPTRTGYTLNGLYTAASGGTKLVNANGTPANDGTYSKNNQWLLSSDVTVYAQWTANSVTVTFNGNGGTIAKNGTQTFTSGKGQSFADTGATRAGYTLLGWADSSTATAAQYSTLIRVSDSWIGNGGSKTIYAIWKANSVTVTFNGNGGTIAKNGTQTFTSGKGQSFADTGATRAGYTLLGWADSSTATAAQYSTLIRVSDSWIGNGGSKTIYAIWKANTYTVVYHENGGSNRTSRTTVTYDQNYKIEAYWGSTRAGYTPDGWATSASGNTVYTPGQQVKNLATSGEFNLYQHWKINTYTISYNLNGGAVSGNPTSYNVTTADITLKNPTRTGYTFTGWTGSNDLSSGLEGYTTDKPWSVAERDHTRGNRFSVTAGKTYRVFVTAKRTKGSINMTGGLWYTAQSSGNSWDGCGGAFIYCDSASDGYSKYYKDVTVPSGKTQATTYIQLEQWSGNYTTSWNIADIHVVEVTSASLKIPKGSTGNRSYIANWKINQYTITRRYRYENADGSFGAYTNIDSKAYNYGTTIPAWNRAADSTYKAASIAAYTVQAKNDTLSVNVMRNTSTNNKIQYRLQNADGSWGAYTQAWSGTLRAGQSHTWSRVADTTHQVASGTVQYNGGTVSVDVKRKVGRFVIKANGGSGDKTTSNLYYGQTNNNISPMPTRTGYTLNGLYTAASGGTKLVNANGTPANDGTYSKNNQWLLSRDVTVYAQWTINKYYFDVNPDSGIASFDITIGGQTLKGQTDYYVQNNYGTTATITNVKPKTGHTYTGYYVGGSMSKQSDSNNTTIKLTLGAGNGAVALTSRANIYTVNYYNGGTKLGSSSHTYGTAKALTTMSALKGSKSGYSFYGWSTANNNLTRTYTDGQSVSNLTATDGGTINVYAIWQQTVNFYSGSKGGTNKTSTRYCNNTTYSMSIPAPVAINGWAVSGYIKDKNNVSKPTLATSGSTADTSSTNYYAIYTQKVTFYSGINKAQTNTATEYYNSSSTNADKTYYIDGSIGFKNIDRWSWLCYTTSDQTSGGNTYQSNISYPTTSANVYYSIYRRNISITYNANGGTGTMDPVGTDQYYNSSGIIGSVSFVLKANGFSKAGYSFRCWKITTDGHEYNAGATCTLTPAVGSTTTTYRMNAQWTINTYTITYNANGGTGTMANQKVTYNSWVKTNQNKFTRSGYQFDGWTDSDGKIWDVYGNSQGTYEAGTTRQYTYTKNITLKARWVLGNYYNTNHKKYFEKLNVAFTSADSGNTIQTIRAVTESNQATVTVNKTINWNTNHLRTTLSSTLVNNGTLNLSSPSADGYVYYPGGRTITNNGTLSVGKFVEVVSESSDEKAIFNTKNLTIADGATVENTKNTAITNNGGTITSEGYIQNTSTSKGYGIETQNGTVNIKNGHVSAYSTGIFCWEGNTVNVSGGDISGGSPNSGAECGIYAYSGTSNITVSGGSIHSGENKRAAIRVNASGSVTISNSANISSNTEGVSVGGTATFTMTGGTITGSGNGVVITSTGSATMLGGTITTTGSGKTGVLYESEKEFVMSGGTITAGSGGIGIDVKNGKLEFNSNSIINTNSGAICAIRLNTSMVSPIRGKINPNGAANHGGSGIKLLGTASIQVPNATINSYGPAIDATEASGATIIIGNSIDELTKPVLKSVVNVNDSTDGVIKGTASTVKALRIYSGSITGTKTSSNYGAIYAISQALYDKASVGRNGYKLTANSASGVSSITLTLTTK